MASGLKLVAGGKVDVEGGTAMLGSECEGRELLEISRGSSVATGDESVGSRFEETKIPPIGIDCDVRRIFTTLDNDRDVVGIMPIAIDLSLDTIVDVLHVVDEGQSVVVPVVGEGRGSGPFGVAELDGDLHITVGVEIVPVLHSSIQDVPLSAVGDATGELLAGQHGGIGRGPSGGDGTEDIIIRTLAVHSTSLLGVSIVGVVGDD